MTKIYLSAIAILLLLNIFAFYIAWDLSASRDLLVDFLNVGQGDSTFIQTRNHQQVLIDGGPSSAVLDKLSKQMPFYDKTIELVILSHPEKDHLAGLLEVLKRYKVKNILWNGIVRDTAEWQEWEKLIAVEGAKIEIAKAGERIVLGAATFMDILSPGKSVEGQKVEDSNDTSIVALLKDGEESFLFTGDIDNKIESILAEKSIQATVLKVAHHGSKTSSSEVFLKELSPQLAVISVGKNTYGHPTPEVLAKLENFGIQIKRTDLNGDVKIYSTGKSIKTISN